MKYSPKSPCVKGLGPLIFIQSHCIYTLFHPQKAAKFALTNSRRVRYNMERIRE